MKEIVIATNKRERAGITRILRGYADHPFLGPVYRSVLRTGDDLRLTLAQAGALLAQLEVSEAWNVRDLKGVYRNLVIMKRRVERADDVSKTWTTDGRIRIDDGVIVIVRKPMHWELEELAG